MVKGHSNTIGSLLLASLMMLSGEALYAQKEFRILADLSKNKVVEGDQVTLTYKVQGAVPTNYTLPKFDSTFKTSPVVQGVEKFSINGATIANIVYSFKLMPSKAGVYHIPPASFTIDGANRQSEGLELTVLNGEQQKRIRDAQIAHNIFIRATFSNDSPFVGEQVQLQYKVYSKFVLGDIKTSKNPAGLDDANFDIIDQNQQISRSIEVLNNERFHAYNIYNKIIFPKIGEPLKIAPLNIKVKVPKGNRRDFFGRPLDWSTHNIASDELVLFASELPSPKPENFTGLVGDFNFNVALSDTHANVNDLVTYSISLSGTGNINDYEIPKLNTPIDIEMHEPVKDERFGFINGLYGGKIKHNYPLVPTANGQFKLPDVHFSFFSVKEKEYVVKDYNNLVLTIGEIAPSTDKSIAVKNAQSNQDDNSPVDIEDIRFIHQNNLLLSAKGNSFFGSYSHVILASTPFCCFLLLLFWKKRNQYRESNPGIAYKKSLPAAKKILTEAERSLQTNDLEAFFKQITTALSGYCITKYQISPSELSLERIKIEMTKTNVSDAFINRFSSIWKQLELAKYAPYQSQNPETLLNQVQQLINDLD